MKIELKKLNKPDGKIWYCVVVDGSYQSPFHFTEAEDRQQYDQIIKVSKLQLPAEETLLSETIETPTHEPE